MKRIKGLFGLGAAVAAALTLGACSQDETAGGDGALCPMELTATGLEPMVTPMTRATVHGDWNNVKKVAVKVGSEVDGVVKLYTVADGATTEATLTSTDPFYWPASGSVTVSAWWPYNADMTKPDVVVKSDQSGDGYAASDFIEAVNQPVTKGYPKLVFEHRTAKICVTLTAGTGVDLTSATVSIAVGEQTVEKCLNASADGHLALIVPTAEAEELTVKIAAGGKNYVYKHTAVEYEANCQYTFNLKLKGDEVALSGCTITGWNETTLVEDGTAVEDPGYTVDNNGMYHVTSAKGLKAWAEAVANSSVGIECELENDIEMPAVADGESNWEPVAGSYGVFTSSFYGNGHTITGLVVNKTGDKVGFIAYNSGLVKDLTLKDAKITGSKNVGAVAGENSEYGIIENCHVTGASEITGTSYNVGGVAGINDDMGTILACHVAKDCKVSGQMEVGGIAGENNSNITGCYALCSLTGNSGIGGICGKNNMGLTACYSNCSYSLGSYIGGIAGDASSNAAYIACYYANCTKGVGKKTTDPNGVTEIEGETTWATACGEMNKNLTGYEFYVNTDTETSADEPLVLRKTNE